MARVMQLGPIVSRLSAFDLEKLIHERLVADTAYRPELSVPLIGYMAWPNDEVARRNFLKVNTIPLKESNPDAGGLHWSTAANEQDFLKRLKSISLTWSRVADVFENYYDLQGMKGRGGASIGKGVKIVAETAKDKGTASSTLWDHWAKYKDVAHLVTASILITGNAWELNLSKLWKLPRRCFQVINIVQVLPDAVLATAQDLQTLGLSPKQKPHSEPALNPSTVWRIPKNDLPPLHPPMRKIGKAAKLILKNRRAGNRDR